MIPRRRRPGRRLFDRSFAGGAAGSVVLLLHCDGADASTSFPDTSGHSHTVTPSGAAQVSTAQSVFGGASAKFSSSSSDNLKLDGSSDFSFGPGDFTIEQWVRFDTLADYTVADWAPGPQIRIKSDGHVVYAIGGVDCITSAAALSVNTSYHVVAVRASGTTQLFIGGVAEATTYVGSEAVTAGANCPVFGGPYLADPATTAWVNQVVTNGGTVSVGRKTIVDNLIVGLKSDGVWTKLDRLWLFAGENSQSALTDLVSLVSATAVNSPTFTANRGYNSNSAVDRVDTNTNLSTYGGQFTSSVGHMSGWQYADAGSNSVVLMGSSTNNQANNQTTILPNLSNTVYLRCNDGTPSGGVATPSGQGHFVVNRSGVSASQGYRNGSNVITPNAAAGSPASCNVVVLGMQDVTGGFLSNSSQPGVVASMASIGNSLSPTDVLNFYTRLQTYMTAMP